MTLSPQEQEMLLTKKIDRSNAAIKWSVIGAIAITMITMFFIVFQLFSIQEQINQTLIQGQKNAANNHTRTQQYIKCIVLLPLDKRNEENFEKCAKTGVVDPKTGAYIPGEGETNVAQQNTSSEAIGGVTTAPIPSSASETPRNQETTGAGVPPNPNPATPAQPPKTGIDRVQDSLKELLNGVESAVDKLEKGI